MAGLLILAGGLMTFWPGSSAPVARAREALARGQAVRAEQALIEATRRDPADPIPWRLWLELLRLEDRRDEARRIGRSALEAVPPRERLEVLRAATLAVLADVPDDVARTALRRFVDADPADPNARAALLRRVAADARPGDPSLQERIVMLEDLLQRHPEHLATRETLIEARLDAGEPARAVTLLDAWPAGTRDARYHRLQGRLALEFEHDSTRAIAALSRAAAERPHDGATHYLLTRALHAGGESDEARREARTVARLRELLEPRALGRRLDTALARLDRPQSRRDLAELCAQVGLDDLAEAWRGQHATPAPAPAP